MRLYDAVVIGGGVFGVWIAYHLQTSGKAVLVLDAYGPGNNRSSSGDESRGVRIGYGCDELYSLLAKRSLKQWLELLKDRNHSHLFQRTGSLWMGKKDDPYMCATSLVLRHLGVRLEEFAGAELAKRYPQFNSEGIEWATFEPDSGALLARQAVGVVMDAFLAKGGEYLRGKVAALKQISRLTCVATESGEKISAGVFIFACGPWLAKVFPELLARRLFVTRQEVFYFGAPCGLGYGPGSLPVWCHHDDQAYGFPDLENRGVKSAFDDYGTPFDPDTEERLVSREGLSRMRAYLSRRIPGLAKAMVVETRVCQYENTSNGDFLLDRHPEASNVWLAGGGSGHGFKHGPAVGEYISSRIEGLGKAELRFSLAAKGTLQNRTVF